MYVRLCGEGYEDGILHALKKIPFPSFILPPSLINNGDLLDFYPLFCSHSSFHFPCKGVHEHSRILPLLCFQISEIVQQRKKYSAFSCVVFAWIECLFSFVCVCVSACVRCYDENRYIALKCA